MFVDDVSVPLPGFSGLRPLDGIQKPCNRSVYVSVPLPGFSGLRPMIRRLRSTSFCFSPVAGIQWVETLGFWLRTILDRGGFSPVAGIQWVETSSNKTTAFFFN